jgi:hypothetical protein
MWECFLNISQVVEEGMKTFDRIGQYRYCYGSPIAYGYRRAGQQRWHLSVPRVPQHAPCGVGAHPLSEP